MAKGQQRGTRELKKPKKAKDKAAPVETNLLGAKSKNSPGKRGAGGAKS